MREEAKEPCPQARIGPLDDAARTQLFALCQRELRQMAERIGAGEVGHTLQPTALLNETFLKLFHNRERSWNDRAHFLRFAARTMRSVLVDHKRRHLTRKHGGGTLQPLDEVVHALEARCGGDLVAVHDALDELGCENPDLADYVTLRFFGGRTNIEVCKLLGISCRTGERHWAFARRWLEGRLSP